MIADSRAAGQRDNALPSLAHIPHIIAASASASASSSAATATTAGSAYKLASSSSSSSSASASQQRAAVKRVRNIAVIANHHTNTVHIINTAAAPAATTDALSIPAPAEPATTTHIPPTQSFSLDPAAGERLASAAPLTTLTNTNTRTTYIPISHPKHTLRAYTELPSTSSSSSSHQPPVQSQTILPSNIFHSDPIDSLHILNTAELAVSHAFSSRITLFQRPNTDLPTAPAIQHLRTWAPPTTNTDERRTITHHFTLFDSTPALHLLRHSDPSLINHERVSALVFRISSPALPEQKHINGNGNAVKKGAPARGRKSALQLMDDLNALPVEPPTLDPNGALKLSTILIQSTDKDAAADDRVHFFQDVVIPGLEGSTSTERSSVLGASDVLACTLHPDGNLAILTRAGTLRLYQLTLSSDATPLLSLNRTIHLNHFRFPTPSSLSKPATVLTLDSTHLLLIGLVALGGGGADGSSNKKLKPRVQAALVDIALEAVVAEADVSALLPPHFSLPGLVSAQAAIAMDEDKDGDGDDSSPVGIQDPGLSISAIRSAGSQVVVVLNTVPLPTTSSTSAGRRTSKGASTSQHSTSIVLPYTLPPHSSVRHVLGRAELTARWIRRVEGGGDAATDGQKEKGEKKRRGGKHPKENGHAQSHAHAHASDVNGFPITSPPTPAPAPVATLAQLRASSDWEGVLRALRTRPDLSEDELVQSLFALLPRGGASLGSYLRAFLPLPLSRPLVRVALKRHFRLSGKDGDGDGDGDEVVGGVVVLAEVLCGWVEEWGRVPLHRSGWVEEKGSGGKETKLPLPRLDEIILLLTDLLDTFFPTLLSSSLSSPQAQTTLDKMHTALAAHSAHLSSLSLLLGPLRAFAVLEADRVRAGVRGDGVVLESEDEDGEGGVHPALRDRSRSRSAKMRSKAKAKGKGKDKAGMKAQEAAGLLVQVQVQVQARSMTGGGDVYVPVQDGAGRMKRRMMQEASLLVGEYAVEVLEF
ncbi:unnamed protein product [Tilletia laevis]|uniref:Uncharacterized protein n=1 Tax=Tilletia laevis TaxID=157183 RepID=A0A9N8M6Y9_9BASI|nr:unnamed protein product [Tilletia laevis]